MRVVIEEAAWRDLDLIAMHIAIDHMAAAGRQVGKIIRVIEQLGRFPGLSREGRARGTRESVVAGTSYIVVFTVSEKPAAVIIVGVVHGARER